MKLLNDKNPLTNKIFLILYASIIAVIYLLFVNRYRTAYIDDAWTLSWAWNFFHEGTVYDLVFGYLNGDGGTSLFSRSFVFVYGGIASLLGWSRGVSYMVSTLFTLASGFIWYLIIKKMGYGKEKAWAFAGVMLLLEIYYGMGHKIRVDALSFFLISLSFYLFISEIYYFSGLTALIAVENHPYSMIIFLYIIAYLFVLWPRMKEEPRKYILKALIFVGGCITGLGYYLLLHWPYLQNFSDLGSRIGGNAFLDYFFFKSMSWRHWPEIAIFLAALIIFFIRKDFKKDKFILPFLVASILFSIIMQRANSHYVVYLYPPVILLIVNSFSEVKMRNILLTALLLFQLPQYGYLFWTQREYNQREYLKMIESHIPEGEDLFILGESNEWFILKERNFHAYGYFTRAGELALDPDEIVSIETVDFEKTKYKEKFMTRAGYKYRSETLHELKAYNGDPILIRRYWKE